MDVESQNLPSWAPALAVLAGLVTIAAGLLMLVVAKPMSMGMLGLLVACYVLAFALVLLGIEKLVTGIASHAYKSKKRAS